ncbi:phosphotransferase [Providencia rettgeri]|uniref:phosphotransferase n=1 Tax=Providencia rettgeri TaxID=587 RepID=UPI00235EF20E|nr:phosphotransferase [Providencia rettgeri]
MQSLLALLSTRFPAISTKCWEISPLVGLSGGSFLVESHQPNCPLKLVARVDTYRQNALYVSRHKEARILRQIQHLPFAQAVVAHNAEWLVLAWSEGQHPSENMFYSREFQQELASIIATLHCSSLLTYTLPLRAEIAHYGERVDQQRFSPRWKRLHRDFLQKKMPKTLKLAPAHMDIHPKNIVIREDEKLMLLDWEYTANTDIAFSLETYFQFNNLTVRQRQQFLTQYCDIQGAYHDKFQLTHHCNLWSPWVKYMTLMWYEVQWHESRDPDFLLHSQPLRQYFNLLG